jgi:hypothetical protein
LGKEEEGKDRELDDTVTQLGISEYHENKSRRFLAGRLDRYNPLAFSKRSSTYAFESRGREYKITIEVDTFDTGEKSTSRSLMNAMKSPPFIITSILCSATICLLALVSLYSSSSIAVTFTEKDLGMLDRQYSQILDRCEPFFMNDNRPDPRIFGVSYSICNKAINQLEELCNEHHISTCEDERLGIYLVGNKPRL